MKRLTSINAFLLAAVLFFALAVTITTANLSGQAAHAATKLCKVCDGPVCGEAAVGFDQCVTGSGNCSYGLGLPCVAPIGGGDEPIRTVE